MRHFNKLVLGLTALAGITVILTAPDVHADSSSSLEQQNESYLYGSSSSSSAKSSSSSKKSSSASSSSSSSAKLTSSANSNSSYSANDKSAADNDVPNADDYTIKSATQYRLRVINSNNDTFWDQPYSQDAKSIGSTGNYNGQLVQPVQIATDGDRTYFQVKGLGPKNSDGKTGNTTLGWVNASALVMTSDYELPFYYSSQLYPTYAPDACEAISLKMALSVRGLATNVSNKAFIDGIPITSSPNYGYTADPYRHGSHATIYPAALARYAKKWTNNAYDITGASKNKLIYEIRHGNPVVFEGSWRMQQTKSDHIAILVGYKPGYFKVADPYMRKNSKNKIFWTSTSNFMSIFNTPKRGARAMVLK